jgi:predicted phosphoribosyltransferase
MISSIKNGSFIRITDRKTAAILLSNLIKYKFKNIPVSDITILGIVHGGVIMADIIAEKLALKNFNIIIPRRLRSPNIETSIGAVINENNIYLNQFLINKYRLSQTYISEEIHTQVLEINRLLKLYIHIDNCSFSFYKEYYKIINDKIVIIIDDGIASGSTLIVSSRWLKKMKPKELIIASPVAPRETLDLLKKEVDYIDVLITPSNNNFHSVSKFYTNFIQVEGKEIIEILNKRNVTL